jgi:light-harvesting complex I chlorophyll a/b binding protein 1
MRMSIDMPKFNPKTYPGITGPLDFFDPLGFTTDITEADFKKYRESELKHGRVAMIAVLGVIAGELFPFLLGGKITGPAIYQFQQADPILNAFTANVIGLTAAVEGYNIIKGWAPASETFSSDNAVAGLRKDYENGDLKFDPLDWKPTNPKALAAIKNKEINNGRLAMIAIVGIVAQELATGSKIF